MKIGSRASRIPERRWLRIWLDTYKLNGGWAGHFTLTFQREHAITLFRAGSSAKAAGIACAWQYRLHSQNEMHKELAGFGG